MISPATGFRLSQGALIVAALLLIVLSLQARTLRADLETLEIRANILPVGSYAALFEGVGLDGDTVALGTVQSPAQLFFVYNTRCPFSERTIPAWEFLHERYVDSESVRIHGIVLDSVGRARDYHATHGLRFSSIELLDRRIRDIHRMNIVPQTIVMNSEGMVVYSRLGLMERGPATDSIITVISDLIEEEDPPHYNALSGAPPQSEP